LGSGTASTGTSAGTGAPAPVAVRERFIVIRFVVFIVIERLTMFINDKFKLVGHEVVAVPDVLEWAQWFETAERKVMSTTLIDGSRISTFFLGLNHQWGDGPPVLFETALFSGEKTFVPLLMCEVRESEVVARYSTWGEACHPT